MRSVVPLDAAPVALGDSAGVSEREPVLIASAGDDNATFAWIVSKRAFTGNWEYRLDQALYTSPPSMNWSGAALIDKDGKLLGIGSLIVREATEGEPTLPGNMFVPDRPAEADPRRPREGRPSRRSGPSLARRRRRRGTGPAVVTRVSPDGPADRAGLKSGDIILAVGGDTVRTQSEFYTRVWDRGRAGDEIPLKVLQGVDVQEVKVRSIDRTEYFRPKTMY